MKGGSVPVPTFLAITARMGQAKVNQVVRAAQHFRENVLDVSSIAVGAPKAQAPIANQTFPDPLIA